MEAQLQALDEGSMERCFSVYDPSDISLRRLGILAPSVIDLALSPSNPTMMTCLGIPFFAVATWLSASRHSVHSAAASR